MIPKNPATALAPIDLDCDLLHVAIAGRGMMFKDGGLLYRDVLVWGAAPSFQLRLDRPVPLVTLPPHCTHRGISLEALDRAGIPWRFVYVSSSTAGLRRRCWAGSASRWCRGLR